MFQAVIQLSGSDDAQLALKTMSKAQMTVSKSTTKQLIITETVLPRLCQGNGSRLSDIKSLTVVLYKHMYTHVAKYRLICSRAPLQT